MSDTGTPSHTPHRARHPRPGAAVQRQGLALRFALIIGDGRLAGALRVTCQQDVVTVEFPETTVRVALSPLPPETADGVLLRLRASYRSGDRTAPGTTRVWQRALTGRPGAPHQREALLREVLAARSRAPGRAVARPRAASLRYLAAAV